MRLAVRSVRFREGPTVPQLYGEPPDEHACRGQLDHAVNAEGKQGHRARGDATANRHARFDDHPGKRQVFKAKSFSNERLASVNRNPTCQLWSFNPTD
jgi:hypothetical protein